MVDSMVETVETTEGELLVALSVVSQVGVVQQDVAQLVVLVVA